MPLRTIILAPDSFKETLSATDAARAMAEGIARVSPSIITHACPVADGGEGTLDALLRTGDARAVRHRVTGPLDEMVDARLGVIHDGRIGVVELAEVSGLALVPPSQRDPMRATSFGTGQLLFHAIDHGCEEVIVCIGGSATVDGGTGIAQACGWRFLDREGNTIAAHMCGGLLHQVAEISPPARPLSRVRVACDVINPLCGPNGAAAVYGPQKGATPEQVRRLDEGLAHLARTAGGDRDAPGAGAAGGAGYGLATFFNATLERGIDLVLEAVGFRDLCSDADLVITGEGRLDAQSLQGKACMGVAKAAYDLGVPTIAIVGSTGPGAEDCVNPARGGLLREYVSLTERFGGDEALRHTASLIAQATEELIRRLSA